MFYVVSVILLLIFLLQNYTFMLHLERRLSSRYRSLIDREKSLNSVEKAVGRKFKELVDRINDTFFVYELARDISPLLDKRKLLEVFKQRLEVFGGLKKVEFVNQPKEGYSNHELKTDIPRYLTLQSSSKKVKEYLPVFLHQLNLCLERIELYKKLQRLSINDALTGIFNRRYFMERFLEEFSRAQKFSFNLSFLMVDIDHFKSLNDTYGHVVGDVALKEVVRILTENVRKVDFVARFGGEEFSIVLTETDKQSAIMVAKRIVETIASSNLRAFDEDIKLTVSIGVASYPENTSDSGMLIELSDKALYKAKESGRNIVCWF